LQSQKDTLIRYLLDELQHSEQGHIDALCPPDPPTFPLDLLPSYDNVNATLGDPLNFSDSILGLPFGPPFPSDFNAGFLYPPTSPTISGIIYLFHSASLLICNLEFPSFVNVAPSLLSYIPTQPPPHIAARIPHQAIVTQPVSLQQNCRTEQPHQTPKDFPQQQKNNRSSLPPAGFVIPPIPRGTPKADVWRAIVSHWIDGVPSNSIHPLREWPKERQTLGAQGTLWGYRRIIATEFLDR
jgi:hypothetical protein